MTDFVPVYPVQNRAGFQIANRAETFGEGFGVVEICLLKGQRQPAHVVHGRVHGSDKVPEKAAYRVGAERHAELQHALQVKPGVFLLVKQRLENAAAESSGRVRELQQHQRHQFRGQKFVVREEMEQPSTRLFVLQLGQ